MNSQELAARRPGLTDSMSRTRHGIGTGAGMGSTDLCLVRDKDRYPAVELDSVSFWLIPPIPPVWAKYCWQPPPEACITLPHRKGIMNQTIQYLQSESAEENIE